METFGGVLMVMQNSFNFLASLINGNVHRHGQEQKREEKPFNFLASLINGNLSMDPAYQIRTLLTS